MQKHSNCQKKLMTRAPAVCLPVRQDLGHAPLIEGLIAGETTVYFERYLFQSPSGRVRPVAVSGLIVALGGAAAESTLQPHHLLPTQAVLIGAQVPTAWQYRGTVDFALLYLLDPDCALAQRVQACCAAPPHQSLFSDALVSAGALELSHELLRGPAADSMFMQQLCRLLFEQSLRRIERGAQRHLQPGHVHYARLQGVLNHIAAHPAEDLGVAQLAERAGVSLAHFRRLFQQATGLPPHRYVLEVRLARARQLLSQTRQPIAQIAAECGFTSQSHLTACFRQAHATTPAAWRSGLSAGR